jgi:hypothetical protein
MELPILGIRDPAFSAHLNFILGDRGGVLSILLGHGGENLFRFGEQAM